jgi:hypothetical protein
MTHRLLKREIKKLLRVVPRKLVSRDLRQARQIWVPLHKDQIKILHKSLRSKPKFLR